MRVAILGTKGIPATWGGIERHVEDLATCLIDLGHEVTVYCRPYYTETNETLYRGIKLIKIKTARKKSLDAIVHTFLSALHVARHRKDYDVVHFHAIGPSTCAWITRLVGLPTVVTVHSLDWDRATWGFVARNFLKFGERTACIFPHATIAVSKFLTEYLGKKYHRPITYIPNGIAPVQPQPATYLERFGVEPGKYFLFVGRLVPVKGGHLLLEAFKNVEGPIKLVMAGGSSHGAEHSDDYEALLKSHASNQVIFTDFVHGADLQALYTHAYAYILPSTAEGMPFTLLEAMSYGLPVIASDIPACKEVVQQSGVIFRSGDTTKLSEQLQRWARNPEEVAEWARLVKQRDLTEYSHESIASRTAELYRATLEKFSK